MFVPNAWAAQNIAVEEITYSLPTTSIRQEQLPIVR